MPCEIKGNTIVCSRGGRQNNCYSCGRPSSKLCDFHLTGEKVGQTCDKPLCTRCAVHVEPDTDYCQPHARIVGQQKYEPAADVKAGS